ncbi:MAG: hypothetical protein U1F11_00495 [Steroidobacteraceae bacterium]
MIRGILGGERAGRALRVLLALLALLVLLLVFARPALAIDSDLVGTWRGEGTVMTSSMQKNGRYLLRIEPDGHFLLVVRSASDFAVDSGRFEAASRGGFVRRLSTGLEDRGTYRVQGDALQFTSIFASWSAQRSREPADEASLQLLAVLERTPVRPRVSDWVARARASALLWQPDAALEYVSLAGLGDDGLLRPDTTTTIGFYSKRTDQFLLLSPTRTGGGALTSSVAAVRAGSSGRDRSRCRSAMSTNWSRASGRGASGAPMATMQLRFFGDSPAKARVLWMATVSNSPRFERHCLDVAAGTLTDCRPLAGDPEKDYRELEARAAAAWAAMQRQSAGGSVDSSSLEMPRSDYERCNGAGGTYNGSECFNSYGEKVVL